VLMRGSIPTKRRAYTVASVAHHTTDRGPGEDEEV
jgi:hypothetical protein